MPSRRQSIWAGLVVAVLALLAFTMRPAALAVEGAAVTRGPMRVTIDEEGQTRVRERWVVSAPVNGRLGRSSLEAGDAVSRGQVVARMQPAALDPRARAEAEAAVRAAAAALDEARSAIAPARTARAHARREAERARTLAAAGAVSTRDVELAVRAEQGAGASLDAASARAEQLAAELQRARAAITDPGSGPAVALLAPAAGRVLRLLEQQQRVVPAGTSIMEIGDPGDIEVIVDLRSDDAVQVRPGAPMLLDGWGGEESIGAVVDRVEPGAFTEVSALGVEEQRVNVIGRLSRVPPQLGDRYRVGVRIVLWERPDVLRVPAGALFRDATGWGVYVVADGHARRRAVTLGHQSADWAEVLQGLAEGELVVLHPSDRLFDGARVSVPGDGD
ncbi:MAG: efflux RND transporter periplasmic adaptor subunit [Gemmatimonadaceae bacterium]